MSTDVYIVLAAILAASGLCAIAATTYAARKRNVHLWLWPWLRRPTKQMPDNGAVQHVLFCFADHFEPRWGKASPEVERERVDRWLRDYPRMCEGHRDSDGYAPRHSFFYPEEEYRAEHLEKLVRLCAAGYGEIEVHLHHDQDTSQGLREKLRSFTSTLSRDHRAIPLDPVSGQPLWSFIHGNWALDNSRPDGRWCGVNDELIVLREEGCYADFTLPSAPDVTQTSTTNSIYYALDDPSRPKSHDTGIEVCVGGQQSGDLMIIQGPLGLMWTERKALMIPRIENGDIRKTNPPSAHRVDFWVRQHVHVKGRPEWIFVKVHTHGTQERDMDALLGSPVEEMFSYLESQYNDGTKYVLHYVSAREMYNIAKAAEAGEQGNPGSFRDYRVGRPGYMADAGYPHFKQTGG